jgi:hypothetical protein
VRVKAEFDNKDGRLWPGQLVTVRLRTAVDERPGGAAPVVQRGIDGHFVYRLDGDKVTSVPVKVLYQDSTLNIIAGVKPASAWCSMASRGSSRAHGSRSP